VTEAHLYRVDLAPAARRQPHKLDKRTGGRVIAADGHSSGTYSHFNGWKIDITKYTCITNYIHRFSYIGLRGDGAPMYRSGSGNVYADEGSHWDLTLYSCGCSFD